MAPSKQWAVTVSRLASYPDFLLSVLHKEVPATQDPARASKVTGFVRGNRVHKKAAEGLWST